VFFSGKSRSRLLIQVTQALPGMNVIGVDRQHVLQADTPVLAIIDDAAQPQPG
jgi:hypothetical protein